MGKQLFKVFLFTSLILVSWNFYAQTKGIKLSDLKPISAFFEATSIEEEIVPDINSTSKEILNKAIKVEETFACPISLISGTSTPIVCEGGAISIEYLISGATNVIVTGLPNGVNFGFNDLTGILTINGDPDLNSSIGSTFNFTIDADSGTCTESGSITVNPTPVIPDQIAEACSSGTAFEVSPANSGATIVPAGTTYTWTVADNPNVTGDTDEPTPQTEISQSLTNTSNVDQTVVYTVTPTSTEGCPGNTFEVEVTVNPNPSVGPTSITYPSVCISSPTLTQFTQSTIGVTGIDQDGVAGVNGLPPGISASFSGNTITFSGTATATGLYTYSIPLIGNCINGLEATGTIDVTPNYEITSISSVSASTSGGSATVTINGNTSTLPDGNYEIGYQIADGTGAFTTHTSYTTVINGKGSFSTIPITTEDIYTVQVLTIKKTTDVCTVSLTSPPTTYFGICGAFFSYDSKSTFQTFYVPANIYEVTIEVYGGGGGGQQGANKNGGGGSGYSIRTISVNPGTAIGIVVGKGGVVNEDGGTSYATFDLNNTDYLGKSILYATGGTSGSGSGVGEGGTSSPNTYDGNDAVGKAGGYAGGPQGDTFGRGGDSNKNGSNGLVKISYNCPDPDDADCIEYLDDGSVSGTTVIAFTCDDPSWDIPEGLIEFAVLAVGGGGGGGRGLAGGGGGGAVVDSLRYVSSNPYGISGGQTLSITVGEGGGGADNIFSRGENGEDSNVSATIDGTSLSLLASGGGGGGSFLSPLGRDGASGGGGGFWVEDADNSSNIIEGLFGVALSGQGNNGGIGKFAGQADGSPGIKAISGGGGGGAGGVGDDGDPAGGGLGKGGKGGNGIKYTIDGLTGYFGAGGGGIGYNFNGNATKEGAGGLFEITNSYDTIIGGRGNIEETVNGGYGYDGVDKSGSGGGAGRNGGGRGGKGIVIVTFQNFKILQVEYLYFDAKYDVENRHGLLSWATSKEWANAKFEIERSIGTTNNWEKIGEVTGQGYKDSQTDYTFTDTQLPAYGGNIFYRLKQVDFEDTFTYSVTRAIQVTSLKGSSNWIIYPNPSELRSNVTVGLINPSNYHDEPIIVRISDVRGVMTSYSANSIEEVNQAVNSYLETAISGMHIVQLIWGDQSEQLKLIRK